MKIPGLNDLSTDFADSYMERAVNKVDAAFGKGYALKHPELIAAFMQTVALTVLGLDIQSAGETVAEAINNLDRSDGLTNAVQNIAAMLDLHSCGKNS